MVQKWGENPPVLRRRPDTELLKYWWSLPPFDMDSQKTPNLVIPLFCRHGIKFYFFGLFKILERS